MTQGLAIHDWAAETTASISARLDSAKAAQGQARITLATLTVISMMMVVAAYNAYLSYDSEWVRREALEVPSTGTVLDTLRSEELKEWVAAQQASVSLLGIQVSVDDAPVLGTMSLAVASLWLVLLMRRENHTVGSLLRDTDSIRPTDKHARDGSRPSGSDGLRWLIYQTLVSNSLFVLFDDSLARVDSLDGLAIGLASRKMSRVGRIRRAALRFAGRFFFLFPVTAALTVFLLDVRSYFQPDPFESMRVPGWEPFIYRSIAIFLTCWLVLAICCWSSLRYSIATERVIRVYGDRLQRDILQTT